MLGCRFPGTLPRSGAAPAQLPGSGFRLPKSARGHSRHNAHGNPDPAEHTWPMRAAPGFPSKKCLSAESLVLLCCRVNAGTDQFSHEDLIQTSVEECRSGTRISGFFSRPHHPFSIPLAPSGTLDYNYDATGRRRSVCILKESIFEGGTE